MSARPLMLTLAITAFAVTVAAVIYHRPYFRGATIVPSAGHPEVTKYAQEFADSLSISTHWNTGEPLSEPHIYLQGGDSTSPDGRFALRQRRLRNDYHEITLSRGQGDQPVVVLVLQEGDPGSGTSHDWRWSHDSEAVFIYGAGKPAGHAHSNNLALIYIVGQRTLYSIDLTSQLAKRLNANTNAPNESLELTCGAGHSGCCGAPIYGSAGSSVLSRWAIPRVSRRTKPMKRLSPATALRHVYHSVYLQILLGGVLAVLIPAVTHRTEILGADARHAGGMMIFMGLNVYCYLRRYEKALAANVSNEPNVA